jgi:hypothetical protein
VAVAHQPSAAIIRFLRCIGLQQNGKFGLNRLLDQSLRTRSQQVRQWIR